MRFAPPDPETSAAGSPAVPALTHFHARAGVRVALRNAIAGTMVFLVLILMAPDPAGLFGAFAASLGGAGSGVWAFGVVALLAMGLSRQATAQVVAGRRGWLASLPISRDSQRRAAVLALLLAQGPLLVAVLGAVIGVALDPAIRLAPLKLLAIGPVLTLAALMAVPPLRSAAPSVGRLRPVLPLALRVQWRAIGWRAIPPLVIAALPLLAAAFYRANNVLSPAQSAGAMRWGSALAVVALVAGLANALHAGRAVWGWERSLPWSSARRVAYDAGALALGTTPALVVVAIAEPGAALAVLDIVPLLAILGGAAIPVAGRRLTAAGGEVMLFGLPIAILTGLTPWTGPVCLAALPLALRFAGSREQNRVVTGWGELHHTTRGDAAAWDGT